MNYEPHYTITSQIINQIASNSEIMGQLRLLANQSNTLRLRRIRNIRTVHGSLAIEGNSLSQAQVEAILEGKLVIAPPREIQEVKNALAAYEQVHTWRSKQEKDLLDAHQVLMANLIDKAGMYRRGGVGVMAGQQLIHVAPSANRVPKLMTDLFAWLNCTDTHPLIASSVFHYEFEFIHPFADGNGRLGRLWQNLILTEWNPLFTNIPVESLIFEHQAAYYQAIGQSTQQTDSAPFITFMLQMISDAVRSFTPEATPKIKLLNILVGEMSRQQLKAALKLKDDEYFRKAYLLPALEAGLIEMVIPDKPRSSKQKYRRTNNGRQHLMKHSMKYKSVGRK